MLRPGLAAAAASLSTADAQEAAAPLSLHYEVSAVSDYRARGVSASGGDPAVQVGTTAALKGGAYGSVWGSTIDEYGTGPDGRGATLEIDYALGWAWRTSGFDLDVAASAVTYPGGAHVDYIEFPVSISRGSGAWTWTLGGAYAPARESLGGEDNIYGYARAVWAEFQSPVKVSLSAGYERGGLAPGGKWDWSAAVSRTFGRVEAALALIGVDRRFGSDTAVASLTAAF